MQQTADSRQLTTRHYALSTRHRSFAVFAIAMGGHGQAEGTCPEMGHAAEKIYGLFRVSLF